MIKRRGRELICTPNILCNSIIKNSFKPFYKNLAYFLNVFDSSLGHWTLKGGKDPDNVIIDLNSCLFSVIASQIGQNPVRLRKWTALRLKNDLQNLAERIDKIFQLEGNDGVIRMIGGATYTGTCSNDAKMILNNSQGKSSSISRSAGHARGHASNPAIPLDDWKGSVENYTRVIPGHKSAFLSPADQDYVTDLALRTEQARKAMERLNSGSGQEVITISAENLKKLIPEDLDLPKMNIWRDGKPNGDEHDILMVRLILRHHENKSGDQNADVMIQTCLPISDKPREYPTVEEIKQIIRKKEQEEFREERER